MKRGDAGAEVKDLQQRLSARGFDPGPVDGVFGPRTEQAVLAFQNCYGNLAPDGVFGPLSQAALRRLEFMIRVVPYARRQEETMGAPAVFTVVQTAHEALDSDGRLTALADAPNNNLGGVKAGRNEPSVRLWTWEEINGKSVRTMAYFRVYANWDEFFAERGRLLSSAAPALAGRPAYADALRFRDDPARYAVGIWDAGYATDSAYVAKLVRLMGDYHVQGLVKAG